MIPAHARARNRVVLERLERLRTRSEESPLNVLEAGSADLGIIASGIAYAYCREAFPQAWFLKLGMSHPLPYRKVASLYQHVSRVAVVEELDPFIEDQVRALNLPVIGKQAIPADGELDQEIVFNALEPFLLRRPPRRRRVQLPAPPKISAAPPAAALPVRPPVLCPGCSHRSVYTALRRHKLTSMGDIGCYTLGALPPVVALDTCLCMGASIGMMAGFNKAWAARQPWGSSATRPSSTPASPRLIDALYNQAEGLVMVLDNRTTAMTGHQGHPGTGLQAQGTYGPATDIQRLCEGIGVRCETVDANDYTALERAIRDEIDAPGLGVIVALAPCVLAVREKRGAILVDEDRCNLCGVCLKLGCPALVPGETSISISAACTGCALCVEVCRRGSLSFVAGSVDGDEGLG